MAASRWFWLAATALSFLVVGSLWCVDYLPTNDGPQHVFNAHVARRLGDLSRGHGRYLTEGGAITGIGFDTLYGTFERMFAWRNALRLSLSVIVLLWGWGVVALAATLGPQRRWLG